MGNTRKGRLQDKAQEEQAHLPCSRPTAQSRKAQVKVGRELYTYARVHTVLVLYIASVAPMNVP